MIAPQLTPTVLILSDNKKSEGLIKTKTAFESNGKHDCRLLSYEEWWLIDKNPVNILIVDLDTYTGKDCETFKEIISEWATIIYVVCSTLFQRLKYYEDFHTFSDWTNLCERLFFAY